MIPGETLEHDEPAPWELLTYLSHRNNESTLKALQENPVQHKAKLTDRVERKLDSSTVTNIVGDLQSRGLVRLRPDNNQYESTLFGNLSLEVYKSLIGKVGRDAVEFITKSESIIPILRSIDDKSSSLSDLKNDESVSASRSTISSYLSDLDAIGWINRRPPYESSVAGIAMLEAYDSYAERINLLAERRQFLRHFDMKSLPFEALQGTEMVAASEGDTDAPTQAYVDAIKPDSDEVLGITPTINKQYVNAFLPLIRSDCWLELIGDRSVLKEANSTYISAFAEGLVSSTTSFLVAKNPITVGVAIFDRETVWLGAYGWSRRDRAVLTGSNEALLEWALDVYETERQYASPPSEAAVSTIQGVIQP